jgi:hypothetical protein
MQSADQEDANMHLSLSLSGCSPIVSSSDIMLVKKSKNKSQA